MGLKWIGYRFGVVGVHGIPARDLSDYEVGKYGGETEILATGLYEQEKVATKPKPKRAKSTKQETIETQEDN